MMSTREIVTLQFGHYSNFVGSHFWNIQELSFDYTGSNPPECNHDILYREGVNNRNQQTYTPRLLLADLKGSTKTLPINGSLNCNTESEKFYMEWPKNEIIEEEKPPKNEYLKDLDNLSCEESFSKDYKLDTDIETWTDYLFPRLHDRTVNIINEYQHGDTRNGFDTYSAGQKLWKSIDWSDIFIDNIRKYVEECDSMQGFHLIFDAVNGFSGLALGCIEHLVDEYSKTILAHPLIPSHFDDNIPRDDDEREKANINDSTRLVNLILSLQQLAEHVNFFSSMCTGEKGWRKPGPPKVFNNLIYNPQQFYHSSSIIAGGLDTLSQQYRQKGNEYTLSDMCADMSGYGRKMGAASLGIPFDMFEDDYLIDYLNNTTRPLYTALTPSCKIATDKVFQIITLRGISETRLKKPEYEAKEQMQLPAYKCDSVKEMIELYFQANCFLSATNVTVIHKPLQVKNPFPKIFSKNLSKFGFKKSVDRDENVESLPVIAGYHNGNFMFDHLEKLIRDVKRIKFSKMHRFREDGLESFDYNECLDKFEEFRDTYEDNIEL